MSLKTLESQGYGKIITFDDRVIFLTELEWRVLLKAIQYPDIKFLSFDDGGVAMSDIRRYEVLKRMINKDHLIEAAPLISDSPPPTPEQVKKGQELIKKWKAKKQKKTKEASAFYSASSR